MIYVDTSILLAKLFAEDVVPPSELWAERLFASRLVEYEVWNRLHARHADESYRESARQMLAKIHVIELTHLVLERALEPFPLPVRTLDGLHLATVDHLLRRHGRVRLASYDARLKHCAREMRIELYTL